MASIKKRDDGRWRARYRDPDGKEHARHFARKFDAERWLDGVRGELVTGAYIDPNAGKLTVRQYAEEWRMAQGHRVGTQVRVDGHFRLHVYPTLGHRQLRQVRPTEIQAWVRALHQVLSPRTVDNVYRYLSAVFAAAVADGLIRSNPCHGTKLAKAPPLQIVPLEVSHIRAIADAAPTAIERRSSPVRAPGSASASCSGWISNAWTSCGTASRSIANSSSSPALVRS